MSSLSNASYDISHKLKGTCPCLANSDKTDQLVCFCNDSPEMGCVLKAVLGPRKKLFVCLHKLKNDGSDLCVRNADLCVRNEKILKEKGENLNTFSGILKIRVGILLYCTVKTFFLFSKIGLVG